MFSEHTVLWILSHVCICVGFLNGAVVKNLPANAGDTRDAGCISGLGRFPGVGNGNPLQYSCLENSMDRGAWQAAVYGIPKSWTQLSDWAHTHTCYLCSHYHYQNIEHLRDCHPQTFPFLIYSPSLQFCLFHHVIRMEPYSMQHCETTCFWNSSKVSHGSVLCSFLVMSITLLYRCAIIYLSIHPLKGIGLVPLLDGYDFVWAQIFISLG